MDAGAVAGNETHDSTIPAGFTFLAQFLDHDLDFDTTSSIERQADPNAITNFRIPSLDLDNIYGAGPMATPYIYDQPAGELLLLDPVNPDLSRNAQGKALIGDPRNDENMVISQLERAFMRCHNAIVAGLEAGTFNDALGNPAINNEDTTGGESTVFLAAQQLLRWHYQWMIIHEFLPLICGQSVVDDILKNGPRFYRPSGKGEPYIPVEFSVAAYRFGHPTVRAFYDINAAHLGVPLFPVNPAAPAPTLTVRTDLRGGPVGAAFQIEWARFFERDPAHLPQRAKRIEPLLNTLLLDLPNGVIPANVVMPLRSLATRNLLRSEALMVHQVRTSLVHLGVMFSRQPICALSRRTLAAPRRFRCPTSNSTTATSGQYLLAEAFHETQGNALGKTGARIVAELFLGVIDADGMTYRNLYPKWKPTLPSAQPGTFKIVDLLDLAGV